MIIIQHIFIDAGSWSNIVTVGTSTTGNGVTLRAQINTSSSNELITESGISITDYCNHGIARCGELFVLLSFTTIIVPLENGVWIVALTPICIDHIVLTPSFPCRTISLKGDSIFAPLKVLCVNTNNNVLYTYNIIIDDRNITVSITTLINDTGSTPLPQDYLTLMTNVIDRGDFWYFFIGRDLYSINAIQGTVSVGEVSRLSDCDYVKYVAVVDGSDLAYLYCNNSRVYEYDFMEGNIEREYDFPYYPCQDRDEYFYQNDRSSSFFFYRDEFFDITTSVPINSTDHEFGVCLGIRPIFIAINKTQGALLVEINPTRIILLDNCLNSSCEVLLFHDQFFGSESLLIYDRDTQSGILVW